MPDDPGHRYPDRNADWPGAHAMPHRDTDSDANPHGNANRDDAS
jgi:hypothetical protein